MRHGFQFFQWSYFCKPPGLGIHGSFFLNLLLLLFCLITSQPEKSSVVSFITLGVPCVAITTSFAFLSNFTLLYFVAFLVSAPSLFRCKLLENRSRLSLTMAPDKRLAFHSCLLNTTLLVSNIRASVGCTRALCTGIHFPQDSLCSCPELTLRCLT